MLLVGSRILFFARMGQCTCESSSFLGRCTFTFICKPTDWDIDSASCICVSFERHRRVSVECPGQVPYSLAKAAGGSSQFLRILHLQARNVKGNTFREVRSPSLCDVVQTDVATLNTKCSICFGYTFQTIDRVWTIFGGRPHLVCFNRALRPT